MSTQIAVLGGGCFWCLEPAFLDLQGVVAVESGYAGGHVQHPTYEEVCSGGTGHAEVVRVEFDAQQLSYRDILEAFFGLHDPTTPDRQGNDVGPQYRSVIFTTSAAQQQEALSMIERLTRDRVFDDPIVTEVTALPNYFAAESYHQRYYQHHPQQGYCAVIIAPKLAKFRKRFAQRLKPAR
jgi:peptide-methionine (S)-S-oxide reductase